MKIHTEYISRINKVLDFIENNIDKSLSLEELAKAAHFSKFHFTRIFYGLIGETPFQFVQRIRLEKAAYFLVFNKNKTITEVTQQLGFSDPAVFARQFKRQFGISATEYRKKNSNISQTNSNHNQTQYQSSLYYCQENKTLKWKTDMKQNKNTEVKEFAPLNVAYIRHTGPYKGDENLFKELFTKLATWAAPRGLIDQPNAKWIVVYHDNPEMTQEEKLRTSVCITVPQNTKTDGEVGKMVIDGGKYVVASFEIGPQEFQQAWDWVYGSWLPSSGYEPDDRPSFEMYPNEKSTGKFKVDICVPVKPL